MNGRTYDTRLGRFMQADIAVQSPFDTQSYNRYSYVLNNPLNATDPSGYFSLKEVGLIAVAVVASYVTYGAASGWAAAAFNVAENSILAGAVGGAAAGAVSGGIMSGGSREGILQGAFSGAVMGGIAGGFAGEGMTGSLEHVATTAVAGGGISVLQGGKFGAGFVSAGVTAAAMPAIGHIGNEYVRVAAAAIVGGTTSVISGGKFANGAITAAFMAAAAEIGADVAEALDPDKTQTVDGLTYEAANDKNEDALLFASKGGKQNISTGEFNRRSNPADVQRAMKEAKAAGRQDYYRALKGLLKVIKRGGVSIGPVVPVPPEVLENLFGGSEYGLPPDYDLTSPDGWDACVADGRCT